MTLAVMQPYLFPYIGYFQLIHAADKFVVYDDVNFIKQGWINRNRIVVNGKEYLFTLPLQKISSYHLIKNTQINRTLYTVWKKKFLITLTYAYKSAPYFSTIYGMVEKVLNTDFIFIANIVLQSIKDVCAYLNVNTEIIGSSAKYANNDLQRQARIIDICKHENADQYINMIGGKELYSTKDFHEHNISLRFLASHNIAYSHKDVRYNGNYSIIDILMFNSPAVVKEMLEEYSLVVL